MHKTAKFHVKMIMRSRVMKVYTKSLKNAPEQHNKVIKASLMLALNLNANLITLMSIKPLTTAHFVVKMTTH